MNRSHSACVWWIYLLLWNWNFLVSVFSFSKSAYNFTLCLLLKLCHHGRIPNAPSSVSFTPRLAAFASGGRRRLFCGEGFIFSLGTCSQSAALLHLSTHHDCTVLPTASIQYGLKSKSLKICMFRVGGRISRE